MPPVPAAGRPLSVPVPLPLSTKFMPDGSIAPPWVIAGAGNPEVVTVNEPAMPVVNVALAALVIAGAWLMFRVNACVAFGRMPFAAVKVIAWVPPVPPAGVPLSVAVLLPLSTKFTPDGSDPVTVTAGVGVPTVVTVNVPKEPTVKVVDGALVNAGAPLTVSVKFWTLTPIPLLAVKLRA